jgi:hypothetical protein
LELINFKLKGDEKFTYPSGTPQFTSVFSWVRVNRCLVMCVCFVDRCLSFCTFSFGHVLRFSGSIKSYIRQCCDGNTWSFDPDKLSLLKMVTSNNNTICQHDTTSLTTVCIRMCTGNFCNGPLSIARTDKLHSSLVTIISVVLYIAMFL